MLKSINPDTEEIEATFAEHTATDIEAVITRAAWAHQQLRKMTFAERTDRMLRAAAFLRTEKARLGGLMTAEMGKPIQQSEAEIEKCAWVCEYYAEFAEEFLADEEMASAASESYLAYDPIGPVLAVMPWNFPFWQVFRFAAPALMAGNSGILKHASNVPRCSLAIQEVFLAAGFPEGSLGSLLIPGKAVESVINDHRIMAVTLTGSELAGSEVAAAAGRNLKKTVLELGGSDAFIVLEDADIDSAAKVATQARFQNCGQSCIAAKRFIVVDSVADAFTRRFIAEAEQLKVGTPANPGSTMGPLAREDLLDALNKQLKASVAQGSVVATGGSRIERKGFYFQPTILTNVTPGMPAFDEETFGPLAAIVRVPDAAAAIEMANRSEFGLGCSLWSADLNHAKSLAREIEAGTVAINKMVASDPRLPFGGIKRSGYGRELSALGIREFVNIKTVSVEPAGT